MYRFCATARRDVRTESRDPESSGPLPTRSCVVKNVTSARPKAAAPMRIIVPVQPAWLVSDPPPRERTSGRVAVLTSVCAA